jgi:N5-(cytidine 5'-diphosphoramidyl)-L-glutamine hydrolase
MKFIGISMRVCQATRYDETRDALDRKWIELANSLGFIPILIPNLPSVAKSILETLNFSGFILTGGNSPVSYGGNCENKDLVDELLINYAIDNSLPMLGICRGMQSLVLAFNGTLRKIDGHANTTIELIGLEGFETVNSYHDYGVATIDKKFRVLARSIDGEIKAIKHTQYPLFGIMWHPERNTPFKQSDLHFIKEILCV